MFSGYGCRTISEFNELLSPSWTSFPGPMSLRRCKLLKLYVTTWLSILEVIWYLWVNWDNRNLARPNETLLVAFNMSWWGQMPYLTSAPAPGANWTHEFKVSAHAQYSATWQLTSQKLICLSMCISDLDLETASLCCHSTCHQFSFEMQLCVTHERSDHVTCTMLTHVFR